MPVHLTAKMVDQRYNVTQNEQEKIIQKFFSEGTDHALTRFPPKEKQRLVVLREITKPLKAEQTYNEKELNQALKTAYSDYVLIRRYLIEYGFLDRKPDGSAYWLKVNHEK